MLAISRRTPCTQVAYHYSRRAGLALMATATLVGLVGCTNDEELATTAIAEWVETNPQVVNGSVPMEAPPFTRLRAPDLGPVLGFHLEGQDENERLETMRTLVGDALAERTVDVYPVEKNSFLSTGEMLYLPAIDPARLQDADARELLETLNADHPGNIYLPFTTSRGIAYLPSHDSFRELDGVEPDPTFVAFANLQDHRDDDREAFLDALVDEGLLRSEDRRVLTSNNDVILGEWTGSRGFSGYPKVARLYFATEKSRGRIEFTEGKFPKRVYPRLKLASATSEELLDIQPARATRHEGVQVTFTQRKIKSQLREIPAVREYLDGISPYNRMYQDAKTVLAGDTKTTGVYQVNITAHGVGGYKPSPMADILLEGPTTLHVFEVVNPDAPLGEATTLSTGLGGSSVRTRIGQWKFDRMERIFERETELGVQRIGEATLRFDYAPSTSAQMDSLTKLGLASEGLPADGATKTIECKLFREGEVFRAEQCREIKA
ncbi:hypothetical protein FAZ79_00570 [Guyparkeria sp. SB14A]|uniref:hypothetical protein n=1 Tax=Guyparkeria sp. SB14A TaxID=2571147 RepID=UPI0010AD1773|nr:hypothetical protein [Guyparkeria sp. SB14A]TKA91832.1 hypothetical protein FAZ79_00570 [Guyparkeria sp. SB14A]